MPGGYLGVDIFFVISGYLITTLLLTELAQTGRVSIANFYERRARRLLPALLVVMLASLPFAWHYLLPNQLVDFSKSLIFSLLFSSNFYWHMSLQEYGADSALLKPFLHTWSLAVEEQYYIVFPLLLFGIHKWARRYLTTILIVGLVASLLLAQWMTGRNASFSFYMMPTRFWELLAGGLLAIVVLKQPGAGSNSRLSAMMASLGILLIAGSVLSFNFDESHPGFITIIPVLGTVLVIFFNSQSHWVSKTLARPVPVYLGLLSYSLYLWHYPIFAFGRMEDIEPTLIQKAMWIVLTLILSALTYYLVEKPFRSKRFSRKILLAVLLLTSSTVIFVSLYWIKADGISARKDYLVNLIDSSKAERIRQNGVNCHSGGAPERVFIGLAQACVFNDFPGAPTLVLVGDSHAGVLAGSVRALALQNQLNYVQLTQVGCEHILDDERGSCGDRAAALRAYLGDLYEPTIIYSSRLPLYIEQEKFDNSEGAQEVGYKALDKEKISREMGPRSQTVVSTLEGWVSDGHGLVLLYPVPEQGFHVFMRLKWRSVPISNVDQLPTLSTSYDVFKNRVASSYQALDKVTGPRVRRVYPEKVFCREEIGRCIASESDRLYFGVDNHVTTLGADLIVRKVAAELALQVPDSFRE